MFRALTIAREFGSGGADVGRAIAGRLGWKLLDKAFIESVARAAHVEPQLARRFDERTDSWLERIARGGLWRSFEGIVAVSEPAIFDAETMASLARNVIREAYQAGPCVIVGRGAQCVLQYHPDVFHAFIYAPWHERVTRVRQRLPEEKNVEELIRSMDQQRADFTRTYFGSDWKDPHLYHVMISSGLGEDVTAAQIIELIASGG